MRAFVLGNGPSLSKTNLDLLKGEVSFGVNRINLIYDKTDWRPTHYVRAEGFEYLDSPDPGLWLDDVLQHINMPDVRVFGNVYFSKWLERYGYDGSSIEVPRFCTHYQRHFDSEYCPHMWHLPIVCTYGSVVTVAIQLAVSLGYSPIYLLGCDLGYKDNRPSHFTDEYEHDYSLLRPARYANLDTLQGHVISARSSPVPIYNCTVGGELEVYERKRLEDVLQEKQ